MEEGTEEERARGFSGISLSRSLSVSLSVWPVLVFSFFLRQKNQKYGKRERERGLEESSEICLSLSLSQRRQK